MSIGLTKEDIQAVLQSMLEAHTGLDEAMGKTGLPNTMPKTLAPIAALFFSLPSSLLDQAEMSLEAWANAIIQKTSDVPTSLVFQTSGSTGKPVQITQDFQLLTQEISTQAKLYNRRRRIVCVVPRHHIYGFLFGIMLPHALSISAQFLPPLPTKTFIKKLAPGDLVVGFPMFWSGLASTAKTFPANVHCVTSTGPCPASTIETLKRCGVDKFYEIFGSSETGGLAWRTAPSDSYTLFDYWKTQSEQLIRMLPDGSELPNPLMDAFDWQDNTHFIPMARKDKAVQVAGINVYPEKVTKVILEHKWVQECVVRQDINHPAGRLKAFLVPTSNIKQKELITSVRSYLAKRLSAPETPRRLTVGNSLPTNTMGKHCDWD